MALSLVAILVTALFGKGAWIVLFEARHRWTLVLFVGYCFLIEVLGLWLHWWEFSQRQLTGLALGGIPIEEILLFVLFFVSTQAAWELLNSEGS